MIKKGIQLILAVLGIVYFSSCERDDICVEGDTPLLVIGFFDVDDTLSFKPVPGFRLRAIDNDSILNNVSLYQFSDRSTENDSILIPLQSAANTTTFEFITNSADDDTSGEEIGTVDVLNFNYTVNSEFVSRACGFIANFNALEINQQSSENSWIQEIRIVESNIQRTNQIHVKVLH